MNEHLKKELYRLKGYEKKIVDDFIFKTSYLNRFGDCYFDEINDDKKEFVMDIITSLINNYLYLCNILKDNYYLSKRFKFLYEYFYSKFDGFKEYYISYMQTIDDYMCELRTLTYSLENWQRFRLSDISEILELFYLLYFCIIQDIRYYDYNLLNKGKYMDEGENIYNVRYEKRIKLLTVRAKNRRLGLE